jgi:hypothetical protein
MAMFSGKTQNHIRKPAVAGRFYSGNKNALKEEIYNFFMEAKLPVKKGFTPKAIIVPHAGYVFSGKVAASGFNQIPDNSDIQRVFILASSHQMHFPGASVYCTGNYETPLGVVEVDKTNRKAFNGKQQSVFLPRGCSSFRTQPRSAIAISSGQTRKRFQIGSNYSGYTKARRVPANG